MRIIKKIWEYVSKASVYFMNWLRGIVSSPLDATLFILVILVVLNILKITVFNFVGLILALIFCIIAYCTREVKKDTVKEEK